MPINAIVNVEIDYGTNYSHAVFIAGDGELNIGGDSGDIAGAIVCVNCLRRTNQGVVRIPGNYQDVKLILLSLSLS